MHALQGSSSSSGSPPVALGAPAWRSGFEWVDGDRKLVFGPGLAERAVSELAQHGIADFELLASARGLRGGPGGSLAGAAASVREVGPGQVPGLAAELIEAPAVASGAWIVAYGGGRVIDVAKAVGAVRGVPVAVVPTTLSGAPLTRFHRMPEGHSGYGSARPALVLADPLAMASLEGARLRATAMNALAHGSEALWGAAASPLSRPGALAGCSELALALSAAAAPSEAPAESAPGGGEAASGRPGQPDIDRELLTLAAIRCAAAVDSAGFGLVHALSQSLVRVLETPHAETYAAVLPHAVPAAVRNRPLDAADLAAALATDAARLGARIRELSGGAEGLGSLGARRDRFEEALEVVCSRPELSAFERPRELVAELVEAAW